MKRIDLRLILSARCAEASRLASDSLDRELPRSERWALHFHTTVCGNCRRFLRQLRAIREAILKMPEPWRDEWRGRLVQLSPERRREIKRLLAATAEEDRA